MASPRRVKTPTVLQMEAVECGAAALAIVLGYHGRVVPLEELRLACGVSRDGTKASNVVRAARQYGLDAKGYRKDPADLPALRLPLIVFWNFNHFVVVEGFGRGRVYLNDPASGRRVVSAAEFDEAFTGVVLAFEPTPEFRRSRARGSLWDRLRPRLAGSTGALCFVVGASLALVVPGMAVPALCGVFVDQVLQQHLHAWVWPLLVGLAATALVRGVLTWLQQHFLLRLETKLALTMSGRFLWHVLRLPMEFYTQRYAGEIGARVAINDRVAHLLSGRLATALLNLVTVVFFAVLMLYYDAWLTTVVIGIAAVNGVALRHVARRRIDGNQRLLQERGKLMGTSIVGLQTIETLKASGAEGDFFQRWSGQFAKVANAEQDLGRSSQYLAAVPLLLLSLNNAAVLSFGALRVMEGHLTLGMLVAFQSFMASFLAPVDDLVDLGGELQEVRGDLSRLDDVLRCQADESPRATSATPATPATSATSATVSAPTRLSGELELRDITIGYSRLGAPLIERLSLRLRPGARVAIVGASGSGKSTVARIVCGLYAPWEGEVLFDGVPRHEVPREVLASSLALVDQEIFLFAGTARENLTLWDTTIPEEDVIQAAKDACLHEDLAARPGGYDSRIDEGGRDLSGGQRQRMEIARALAGRPSILVLDEATSALDPITEAQIDDHLRRRGCTCLIVAHRLSTIRDCDEIIVLDQGKVVQRGTHDELIGVEGSYRDLISTVG
jgi:NHLM bacteriocin system ABC transporter peptidase/ATP-binding protein